MRAKRLRNGSALVEFAVCMPVVLILVLGSMEATSAIFVRQALTTSAYEGIRAAVRTGATTDDGTNRAQSVLTARRIRNSSIRFTPALVQDAARGSIIAIEVSASFAANSPFFGTVIRDRVSTVRTVMVKE
jgi:Flp pilus assembly protein TadG